MKILLIHQYFLEADDAGGSRFNEMVRQWVDLGHNVTVLAGMMHANGKEKRKEYKGKFFYEKYHGEVRVVRCHVSESYNKGFVGRLWGYFSFVFSSIWAGLFKTRGRPDLILVTSPPLFVGITAYFLSLIKRVPFVFEVRDLWPESAIDTGVVSNKWVIKFAYWFERFIYKKARMINVLTPAFQKSLIEKKNVPKDKIIFIPNAADFSIADKVIDSNFDRREFRKKHGLFGKFVITYVGAHGVANHLIQVIETAEIVREREKVLFLLIGSGMEKEMLIKEVKKRDLQNIRFVDPVPKTEVFKYILASDFGMSVLKKVDTFKTIYSNKTFDYMACKRPVFMVIDGVSRELIEQAKCGIYVEPENPQDWAAKIDYSLALSQQELNDMGSNGYRYAKRHFDRSLLAVEYVGYLEKIVLP